MHQRANHCISTASVIMVIITIIIYLKKTEIKPYLHSCDSPSVKFQSDLPFAIEVTRHPQTELPGNAGLPMASDGQGKELTLGLCRTLHDRRQADKVHLADIGPG